MTRIVNRLQVEWNEVERPYEGFPPWSFYRVIVDGRTLSDCAHPFDAGDDQIVMQECDHCGHCGHPSVAVRRYGGLIYWFGYVPEPRGGDPFFDAGDFRAFDPAQYEAALGRGRVDDLPEMSRADVTALIAGRRFPDWHDALYTIPDLEGDPQGRVALRELAEAFRSDAEAFYVEDVSRSKLTLRIGLELPGTPEAVYEIGECDSGLAARPVALPDCPVWISGPALSAWAAKVLAAAR